MGQFLRGSSDKRYVCNSEWMMNLFILFCNFRRINIISLICSGSYGCCSRQWYLEITNDECIQRSLVHCTRQVLQKLRTYNFHYACFVVCHYQKQQNLMLFFSGPCQKYVSLKIASFDLFPRSHLVTCASIPPPPMSPTKK